MLTTLKASLVAVCLVAATGARAEEEQPLPADAPRRSQPSVKRESATSVSPADSEWERGEGLDPCPVARKKFLKLTAAPECAEERAQGQDLDCEDDAEDTRRLAGLAATCSKRLGFQGFLSTKAADQALRQTRSLKLGLRKEIDALDAERASGAWYVPGVLSLVGGTGLMLGSFTQSLNLPSGGDVTGPPLLRPFTPETTAMFNGGLFALIVGASIMYAVNMKREPFTARIAPLEERVKELDALESQWDEYRRQSWNAFRRSARTAPRAAPHAEAADAGADPARSGKGRCTAAEFGEMQKFGMSGSAIEAACNSR